MLAEEFEEMEERAIEPKKENAFIRLYRGHTSFDFIGHRRTWFIISSIIIVAGLISLGTRGLNLGIDFKGGQQWAVQSKTLTVAQAENTVKAAGLTDPTVVALKDLRTGSTTIQVQADLNSLSQSQRSAIEAKVTADLASAAHVGVDALSFSDVGPTWGGQVTQKAVEALIVFFIAVVAYITFRFEFKMAVAALIAVIHDILVTVGIYSIFGFQVTPDTVVAILTVLGYSLYDTVVVFDRIGENAKGLGASGRITYSDMVNLSMNQTLARSINTSLVAIVPVLSVLVIGSGLLGATTLQDFGLALVIGLTSGAYSSIFIASPLLAMMKEREPRYTSIRNRLETRGDRLGLLTPAAAAAMGASAASSSRPASRAAAKKASVMTPAASRSRAAGAAGTAAAAAAVADEAGDGRTPPPRSGTRPAGSTRPGGGRPAPRPRKGKGKGGKGKRR